MKNPVTSFFKGYKNAISNGEIIDVIEYTLMVPMMLFLLVTFAIFMIAVWLFVNISFVCVIILHTTIVAIMHIIRTIKKRFSK